MSNVKIRDAELPKRAFTKPSVAAIVFFVIIVLLLVPNTIGLYTNRSDIIQFVLLVFLSPLVLPGFYCAYYTGLAIGKILYSKWHKGLFASYLVTLVAQLICVALCVGIEIAFVGYPIQMCSGVCQEVEIKDAIISYLISSTVLFLPVYYAIYRYYSWHRKLDLSLG